MRSNAYSTVICIQFISMTPVIPNNMEKLCRININHRLNKILYTYNECAISSRIGIPTCDIYVCPTLVDRNGCAYHQTFFSGWY